MRLGVDLRCMTEGEPGGIAVYAREVLRRLPAALPEATLTGLVTGARTQPPAVPFSVRTFRVPNKILNASLVGLRRPALDGLVRAEVWFAPTLKYTVLRPGTPFVLTVHDLSFLEHPEYFTGRQRLWHSWLRTRALLQRATRIIAVSQHTADDIRRLLPAVADRVQVVPSGVDHVPSGPFTPLPTLPGRYLLAYAPRERRKNIATLRAAHRRAFAEHGVPLVLVGSGAGAAGAGTITLGYLTDDERWRVLANATAFVYPSVYEGFGFPPLEAMQLGVPVIASHVTSIPAAVGGAALLIDPWDEQDLARAMTTLVHDASLRAALADAGKLRARAFQWSPCVAATARIIQEAATYAHRH